MDAAWVMGTITITGGGDTQTLLAFLKNSNFSPSQAAAMQIKLDMSACGQATNEPPGGISTTYPILLDPLYPNILSYKDS